MSEITNRELFENIKIGKSPTLDKLLNFLKSKGFEYRIDYKKVEGLHNCQILITNNDGVDCGFGAKTERSAVIYALKMLIKMNKL